MSIITTLLSLLFKGFVIGASMAISVLIIASMVLLEQSIADVIKENHEGLTKHPHLMSIAIIVLTAVLMCLLVKLFITILPLLWTAIKLIFICGAIIFVMMIIGELIIGLFKK